MNNAYQLVVRKGPRLGQIFPLFAVSTTVGRDPISDIAINDPEVSRQHARFTQTSDSYQIEDLESTNGTFVNGVQIGTDPVQLAHGNEIQFGSGVTMIFELMPVDDEEEIGLETETAVAAPPLEELKSDPMMPPDFDQLSVIDNSSLPDPHADLTEMQDELDAEFAIDNSSLTEPHADLTEMQDELDAVFAEENIPPPPPDVPQVIVSPASTPPPPPSAKDENPARRLFVMGMALIILMMCCCCGFLFFMYEWGGDWLLQQMGLLP